MAQRKEIYQALIHTMQLDISIVVLALHMGCADNKKDIEYHQTCLLTEKYIK